jgi:hypothetical protein
MSEATLTNGKQAIDSQMNEAEYRALCKKLRAEQRARSTKKSGPKILSATGEFKAGQQNYKIFQAPTDWNSLENGDKFSLDNGNSETFIKVAKDKAINLNTGKPTKVAAASCYRVTY